MYSWQLCAGIDVPVEGSAPALSRPKWPQRSASLGLEMVIRQDFAGFSREVGGEVSNDNEAMKPMVSVHNICILTSHR